MKSVLINPYTRTVSTVEIDEKAEGLEQYYKLIGCHYVEHVALSDRDGMFIDEEGMLKDVVNITKVVDGIMQPLREQAYFMLGDGTPIAGIALIVAGDDEGNTVQSELGEEFFKRLFEGGHWRWLDSMEQAMQANRERQAAIRAMYEAKGYNVQGTGEFGLFITEKD